MILKLGGNLCVGLAVLLYAVPLPILISEPRSHDGGQSEAWGLLFLMVILWFCLALALCASTANGVDYAPAIRAFRSAFDEPHGQNVKFTAVARLDDWLARDAKRPK